MTVFEKGNRLHDKVAIITGAANGMGACASELFAAHGAKVAVTDIDYEGAKKVAAEITSNGGTAIALKLDISSESAWDEAVTEVVNQFGGVDVLVNNAALHLDQHMSEITLADWKKTIDIDLTGPFIGIQRVIPEMLKAGKGSIVNMCSIAALKGSSFAHYSAAKGGLRSLTRTASFTYAKQNIRVNAIYPGLIKTNLTKSALANPEIKKMLEASTPLPRFGEPIDVAYGMLYLASDESSFVTGSDLIIDGGNTAQ